MIDVDSFVGQVYGRLKQGTSHGYTHVLGYHPLLARGCQVNCVGG